MSVDLLSLQELSSSRVQTLAADSGDINLATLSM
jgi:hypothetical protein